MSIVEINHTTIPSNLPIFYTNIGEHQNILKLAKEAIFEEKEKNPKGIDSNVKASFVSEYTSHVYNDKFQPLINLVLSLCKEVSKKYFNCGINFKVYNCWGMIYDVNDYADIHNHFPANFAAVSYIEVEDNAAPIVFENGFEFVPSPGSLILFPAILNHYVPNTKGRRLVVGMNIHNDV